MTNNIPIWELGVRKTKFMNQAAMTKNLLDFQCVMAQHEIPFIFIFGSLIGLMRENGFIPYDTDADVACLAYDHRKMGAAVKDLEKLGFYVPDRNGCPLHDHFLIREGEKIDVWWFDKIGNEYIYDNRIRYPQIYFDAVETRPMIGSTWNVPHNPETFLNLTYGVSWKIPQEHGHYIL